MKRRVIVCDQEKCTGCGTCELVCSATKDKNFNPRKSRIRVVRIDPYIDAAVACRLCDDAPCVAACPRDALSQHETSGIVVVEEGKCNGCGWCIAACEFGAITYDRGKKGVFSCDLCDAKPVCVEFCTRKALEFTTLDVVSTKARKAVVEKLI